MTKPTPPTRPYRADDISALARFLHKATKADSLIAWNHSRWLNTLAHAAGFANYQSWLAAQTPADLPTLYLPPGENVGAVFVANRSAINNAPSAHAQSLASLRELSPGLADDAYLRVLRALSYLDSKGSLLRWSTKRGLSDLLMWPLWLRLDDKRRYSEGEITSVLAQLNHFGDPVTLRRELIGAKLLARESDGSVYWKLPKAPKDVHPEAAALLAAVSKKISAS